METRAPVFTAIALAALGGCEGLRFNSNLGPYSEVRIKAAAVREYTPVQIARYDAITLGFVEAAQCQRRPDEPKPNRRMLVRELKQRTHNLGGNGVVVEACGTATGGFEGCQRYLECRGVAYAVPGRQSRP
ncbi:hypothetical protein AWR36_004480 [Microbulbifer flavimaris]|uniref:RcsF protein n=1 Tax=Microbulbifer flavimaris TaxID=1781068 RepID=A0ABX4I3K6_9GAMM|nr:MULTISPECIES: hypothetical protein [Microbulbifer]KUJ84898.1 hypothetical protein AVO43_04480 [Microbulbifer sp. ZGT114]PCO06997.1 hypothetical protein AWR36_004480 [Microbulbifer flavimaris]